MAALSDSDDESWKLPVRDNGNNHHRAERPSTSNASLTSPSNATSSSSSSSTIVGGGIFDELNANLRSELQRTRAEVAAMKAEANKRREVLEKMAAEPDEDGQVEDEDAEETARELKLLQDLLNEPLSSSEDEAAVELAQQEAQKQRERERARAAKARAKTASGADKRSKIEAARKQSAANIISPLAAALASSSFNNNSNPWDTAAAASPTNAATPLSPTSAAAAAATQARSRAVLDSFRAKQSRVADYEKRQQNQRAAEGDIEGTVLLKSDLGEQCAVCLDDMRGGDRVASLACCHTFHYPCIVEWMERAPSCPLCKNETPFHPVARQARQNRLDKEKPPQTAESQNDFHAARPELGMNGRISSRPSSAARPMSSSSSLRPTSGYVDPVSEARIRQLRAERSSADSMVDDARFHSTTSSLTGTDRASMERRAASAAAKAVSAASAARRSSATNPSQMSLSQLLKDTSLPGSERYALITGSMAPAPISASHFARSGSASSTRNAARDSITRTSSSGSSSSASMMSRTINGGRSSLAASPTSASSSSSFSSMPRPSSNSSNIRAAAAASLSSAAAAPLSLAPMVSKIGSSSGKLVTGSTVHKSQHRMTK